MATGSRTKRKNTGSGSAARNASSAGKTTGTKSQVKSRSNSGKAAGKKSAKSVKSGIGKEAILLIFLALSVIIFIANFGVGGVVGAAISSFFFGVFGLMAYVFPILLFAGTIFAISNKNSSVARIKLITAALILIFICTLIQLISGNHADEWTYGQYYRESAAMKKGGGFLGGFVCKAFCTWFGVVGAYIIDIVLIIIAIVIITERSFIGGIKKGSKKVYDTARHDVEQYREDASVKRREREEKKEIRLKRHERKTWGVSLERISPKKEDGGGDIREITPDNLKNEASFRFEPAAARDTDDVITDYEQDLYDGAKDVTSMAMRHYEEEQSDAFQTYTGEEQDIPYDTDFIDKSLVMEEYAKEEAERKASSGKSSQGTDRGQSTADSMTESVKPDQSIENVIKKQPKKPKKYVFPPISLLKRSGGNTAGAGSDELRSTSMKLQQTLANFGVKVTVTDVSCGPAVTRYEIQPEQGVKVSKIVSLADDIKLNLAAADIRIEAPIPGKAAVGIEVPNKVTSGVMLGDLIAGRDFKNHPSLIAFAAGKDIAGKTVLADIAKMPHLLIAGATGSGKSVCINTIIMSILYRARPDEVKMIMVDPKVVELSVYNGIPHLMIPVVTDPKKAAEALNWAVKEMSDRYQKFALFGVRDLKGYNEKVDSIQDIEDENKPIRLPQIVIIIDELADLMMVSSNEVEDAIVRLAQLARAAGIHLIIATQRPSVNVITGLIKANVPSRIAFSVSSGIDSRTIIDMNGAEKLLGKGDMLFYPQGYQKPARVQGAFVSDEEVTAVTEFLKEHCDPVEYSEEVSNHVSGGGTGSQGTGGDDNDPYFADAGRFIIEKERASIGNLQRQFKIGFNRAARIMDQLCDAKVVGPEEGTKPRKVLMTMEEFEEYLNN